MAARLRKWFRPNPAPATAFEPLPGLRRVLAAPIPRKKRRKGKGRTWRGKKPPLDPAVFY